jgi:cysteine sulfinate desulfinase/cysteine desulfurase-like protein
MGVPLESAWGALRFSLSYATTAADVDRVIEVFPDVVHRAQKAGLSLPARR